jgi:subtilisin family serine protease
VARTVTLITGDKVTLAGSQIGFSAGIGRRGVRYTTATVDDHLYVIPADVAKLVARGLLDRRLFDVTGLVEAGYDDGRAGVVSVIVSYRSRTRAMTALRGAGLETTRQFGAIGAVAARVSKRDTAQVWPKLKVVLGDVGKVWLDGRRQPVLDGSVPQIGAPMAWQAGYTGAGVTVAVLDTGVDVTHPDLTGRVTASRNFTDAPDGDRVGHGTHVASTIAGTGAASGGRYRGVAPGASVLDGKVCDDNGCLESAILAGMQWAAVDRHADVVNMSLGGRDTPGVDAVEQAVNDLTASTGALFVVAAGNEGPDSGTLQSPGTADAALTVGAVDRDDQLAGFSSRGPRLGDGGLKPDVTAPGVGIVAARARDAWIGEPVGDDYLRESGTSMSTPHVAGAAALLAHQHPGWTATELKATLMGSARPLAGVSVFEQGAGRVDVAQAIDLAFAASPSGLDFGLQRWPHDDDAPVVKQLTYRNFSSAPLAVSLAGELTGPDGQPAPDGALVLSAGNLTVPAGGAAVVSVTVSTRHAGPDGSYSGRVTARAGEQVLTTPVGIGREAESYDLTIRNRDTRGRPAVDYASRVRGVDNTVWQDLYDADGTVEVRLPRGRYVVDTLLRTDLDSAPIDHLLAAPGVNLTHDVTLDMDARLSKPFEVAVENSAARPFQAHVGYARLGGEFPIWGDLGGDSLIGLRTAQIGPALPDGDLASYAVSWWAIPGRDAAFHNSSITYGLMDTQRGSLFTGLTRAVSNHDLAALRARHHAQVASRQAVVGYAVLLPELPWAIGSLLRYDQPSTATNYLEPGAEWFGTVLEIAADAPDFVTEQSWGMSRTFQAGRSYPEVWNGAVFGPSFSFGGVERDGEYLSADIPMFSDGAGHGGWSMTDTAATRLYRNGELVAESAEAGVLPRGLVVPPERSRYRLETTAERSSWSDFSTRMHAAWTFRSAVTTEPTSLPLWTIRFQPQVDQWNRAQADPTTVLAFAVQAQPAARVGELHVPVVLVSGDDGTTWRPARVAATGAGKFTATFPTPRGATHISLRANATDSHGNTVEQTVIRAYALTRS